MACVWNPLQSINDKELSSRNEYSGTVSKPFTMTVDQIYSNYINRVWETITDFSMSTDLVTTDQQRVCALVPDPDPMPLDQRAAIVF